MAEFSGALLGYSKREVQRHFALLEQEHNSRLQSLRDEKRYLQRLLDAALRRNDALQHSLHTIAAASSAAQLQLSEALRLLREQLERAQRERSAAQAEQMRSQTRMFACEREALALRKECAALEQRCASLQQELDRYAEKAEPKAAVRPARAKQEEPAARPGRRISRTKARATAQLPPVARAAEHGNALPALPAARPAPENDGMQQLQQLLADVRNGVQFPLEKPPQPGSANRPAGQKEPTELEQLSGQLLGQMQRMLDECAL